MKVFLVWLGLMTGIHCHRLQPLGYADAAPKPFTQPDILLSGEVMAGHGTLRPDLAINARSVPAVAEERGCAPEQEPAA